MANKKGIRLPYFSYRSLLTAQIKRSVLPKVVRISLAQYDGSCATPCVKESESVFQGTKIAEGIVPIHSSVSGNVIKVSRDLIHIASDEKNQADPFIQSRQKIPIDSEELAAIIREAGIVGLGGDGYPTFLKMLEAKHRQVHTLIINGCESEPFLTTDYILMTNHPVEVLKGIELLRLASGAERAVIATQRNKMETLEILNSRNYNLKFDRIQTISLPAVYPQDNERVLVSAVLGRKLGKNEKPMSSGAVVENIATAFAVYEAVFLGKPLFERVITIEGACVTEPKNLWAPIGISIQDLLRSCKGLLRDPGRLVLGGSMTGESVSSMDAVVTKKVQAVLALPVELTTLEKEEPCSRCGLCVEACPESLVPETLVKAIRKRNRALAEEFEIYNCNECGNCSYICPSNIPMVELIRAGKNIFSFHTEQKLSTDSSHAVSVEI